MDIVKYEGVQLPDNLADLTQFVLVGKAKLSAYMLKLRTVNKLSVAQEIRDQTLQEAQEISTALIAAEQRIGELLLAIPKASGQYAESKNRPTSKNIVISEMGYSKDEAADYQTMAKHPEVVQRVLDEAIANGDVVTKAQVMREIKAAKEEAAQREKVHQAAMSQKDRKIQELRGEVEILKEQAKPQVIEKKIIPEEYKQAMRDVNAYKEDLRREQSRTDEKQKKILELEEQLKELRAATQQGIDHKNLSENVFYFCSVCNNFIGNVGGLVWLTDRLADMPEKERKMFMTAALSFRDWAIAFSDNLERSTNGETVAVITGGN